MAAGFGDYKFSTLHFIACFSEIESNLFEALIRIPKLRDCRFSESSDLCVIESDLVAIGFEN